MSKITEEQKMHHYMGIEMNIQTWNLLERENRNDQDDMRMVVFAQASLYHWRKSYKYKIIQLHEKRRGVVFARNKCLNNLNEISCSRCIHETC